MRKKFFFYQLLDIPGDHMGSRPQYWKHCSGRCTAMTDGIIVFNLFNSELFSLWASGSGWYFWRQKLYMWRRVAGVLEGGGGGVVGFCLSNYQWQLNPQESSGGISQLLLFDTAGTKKRSATLTLWTSCCKAAVLTTMPAVAHSGGKFDWKLILPQILTFFLRLPKDMNFEDQVLSNPDIWPWP